MNITGYTASGNVITCEYDSDTGVAEFERAPAAIKYFYFAARNKKKH